MTREQYENEEHWHEFGAWNSQALYGYGTAAEADEYLDILNGDRMINVYQRYTLEDDYAELVLKLQDNTEAFNIDDALAARKGLR